MRSSDSASADAAPGANGARTPGQARRAAWLAGLALAALGVLLVHGGTRYYGLVADDYQWINDAHHFEGSRLWRISGREHFYRPVMEAYFRGAIGICGHHPSCYHDINIGAHVVTTWLVGLLVGALTGTVGIGVLAAVLFAVQPAPIEAVGWVSALAEVLVTLWSVLAAWTYLLWLRRRRLRHYFVAIAGCALALLTHESAVVLLPMLMLLTIWFGRDQPNQHRGWSWRDQIVPLVPIAVLVAGYLLIAYTINSRNYVVTEGEYAPGAHVVRNIAGALVSYTVLRRDVVTLSLLTAGLLLALLIGSRSTRLLAAWTMLGLLPFAFFQDGLPSRYLYLAAVGAAGLIAELLWWPRRAMTRRSAVLAGLWWLIVIVTTARFAAFAKRNMGVLAHGQDAFVVYAERLRVRYPAPDPGSVLVAPPPEKPVMASQVEALMRWTYGDYTIQIVIEK